MRHGIALFLFALVLTGCSDPARVARREVDRATRLCLVTDSRLQKATQTALSRVAVEEGTAMGQALRLLGCPSGASSQPASAPEKCHAAARMGRERYQQRTAEIAQVARKADLAVEALWHGLRLVIDVLEDLDVGTLSKANALERLTRLVLDIGRLSKDALGAYDAVKALASGGAM